MDFAQKKNVLYIDKTKDLTVLLFLFFNWFNYFQRIGFLSTIFDYIRPNHAISRCILINNFSHHFANA